MKSATFLLCFNKQNNTNIVTVCYVHVEPMALYGGKQTTLDAVK